MKKLYLFCMLLLSVPAALAMKVGVVGNNNGDNGVCGAPGGPVFLPLLIGGGDKEGELKIDQEVDFIHVDKSIKSLNYAEFMQHFTSKGVGIDTTKLLESNLDMLLRNQNSNKDGREILKYLIANAKDISGINFWTIFDGTVGQGGKCVDVFYESNDIRILLLEKMLELDRSMLVEAWKGIFNINFPCKDNDRRFLTENGKRLQRDLITYFFSKCGIDKNKKLLNKHTILTYAAQQKRNDLIHMLLDGDANSVINVQDGEGYSRMFAEDKRGFGGRTALHWAVLNSDGVMVQLLLSKGAKIFIKDKDDCTAYDYAQKNAAIKNLLRSSLEVVSNPEHEEYEKIKRMAEEEDKERLQEQEEENKEEESDKEEEDKEEEDKEEIDFFYDGEMVNKAPFSDFESFKKIIREGDTSDILVSYLKKVLENRQIKDRDLIIQYLKTDVAKKMFSHRVIQVIVDMVCLDIANQDRCMLINGDKNVACRVWVNFHKIRFPCKDDNEIIIKKMGKKAQLELISYLLNCGAHINSLLENGMTLLNYAVREGRPDIVKLLHENGVDINQREQFGQEGYLRSALHWAVHNDDIKMVKLLLSYGIDVSLQDVKVSLEGVKRRTALQCAEEFGNKKIIYLLKNPPAKVPVNIGKKNNGQVPLIKKDLVGIVALQMFQDGLCKGGGGLEVEGADQALEIGREVGGDGQRLAEEIEEVAEGPEVGEAEAEKERQALIEEAKRNQAERERQQELARIAEAEKERQRRLLGLVPQGQNAQNGVENGGVGVQQRQGRGGDNIPVELPRDGQVRVDVADRQDEVVRGDGGGGEPVAGPRIEVRDGQGGDSSSFSARQVATIVALVAGGCAATYAIVTNYFPAQVKKFKAKLWGSKHKQQIKEDEKVYVRAHTVGA